MANLVIRPEKLGDLVVAVPVFRAFKESYPDQPLHLLTDEIFADAVKNDPHLDKIITVKWKGREKGQHQSWLSIYQKLKAEKYERAAILYYNVEGFNLLMAALGIWKVAQLGGTKTAVLLGHKMVLRKMFKERAHYADWYLKVAEKLGAVSSQKIPEVYLAPAEIEAFETRFPFVLEKKKRILIHPFGHGSSPNYSLEAYSRLVKILAKETPAEIFISGSPSERKIWDGFVSGVERLEWLGNLTIREWMVAAGKMDAVVCGSTGVIHLAAALNVPTVGVYCPYVGSHPDIWGPRGGRVTTLVAGENFCGKIKKSDHSCCGTNQCDLAFNIPVADVCAAVRGYLGE